MRKEYKAPGVYLREADVGPGPGTHSTSQADNTEYILSAGRRLKAPVPTDTEDPNRRRTNSTLDDLHYVEEFYGAIEPFRVNPGNPVIPSTPIQTPSGSMAIGDHSTLVGLADDDSPQYTYMTPNWSLEALSGIILDLNIQIWQEVQHLRQTT